MPAISAPIHINQQSADRVLAVGVPVVLAFWRTTDTNLRQSESMLESLAAVYAGRILIARVNAGEEGALAARFGISSTPAFVFAGEGKPETTVKSPLTEAELRAWMGYLTGNGPKPAVPAPKTPAGDGKPVILTDRNFDGIIAGDQPVLVDFWAPWCGPCRMVAPAVEEVAKEFAGRAVVGKLNVDENPETSQFYRIMSIPTLGIFKNGKLVDQMVGVQPAGVIKQRLQKAVNG